jgi:hypothetical protein
VAFNGFTFLKAEPPSAVEAAEQKTSRRGAKPFIRRSSRKQAACTEPEGAHPQIFRLTPPSALRLWILLLRHFKALCRSQSDLNPILKWKLDSV